MASNGKRWAGNTQRGKQGFQPVSAANAPTPVANPQRTRVTPTHPSAPAGHAAVIATFAQTPDARWWMTATARRMQADGLADEERPACEEMSARFAAALTAAGRPASVVEGTEADYPEDGLIGYHRWVECDGVAYDWTVRQFYNVEGPAAQQALRVPVPLVWPAGTPHPLLRFRAVTAI